MGCAMMAQRNEIQHWDKVGKLAVSGRYHTVPRKVDDDYQVAKKVLGRGYSGLVRMATSRTFPTGQRFAVKALELSKGGGKQNAHLESEVEIFLSMDHPHITRLYDVYKSEADMHLVMECMEGGELLRRVMEVKRFPERDAADALWQMLLAANYLHARGIVHRDLKLENFLYDGKGSSHIKLIDFGFSKRWDPKKRMRTCCGTLAYIAPEVLRKSYGSQCDLWSLGVIAFALLSGCMPFHGPDSVLTHNIRKGHYEMKPAKWKTVSENAVQFVQSLMQVNPDKRLTAQKALGHAWLGIRPLNQNPVGGEVDHLVVDALRQFGQLSRFKRCCMVVMAWCLSNSERAKVRQQFISLDLNHEGTITLAEFRESLIGKFNLPDDEAVRIYTALGANNNGEICYSTFLAAMVSARIEMHKTLVRAAFRRLEAEEGGFMTMDSLQQAVGEKFEGESVEVLFRDADMHKCGKISFEQFQMCICADQSVQSAVSVRSSSRESQRCIVRPAGHREQTPGCVQWGQS